MKKLAFGVLLIGMVFMAQTGFSEKPMTAAEAQALFYSTPIAEFNTPFKPNAHEGAQWYPDAGFGLFIHWGIYSVEPTNPSWSMIKNCFKKERPAKISVEDYYKLAEQFSPQSYNPDAWMEMASSIGMKYAVITTKHHDGYCLWPTEYGEYNTKSCMEGRDLIGEYVASCRKYGMKVGFYFSPRDWAYNNHVSGFNNPARGFDHFKDAVNPFSKEENEAEYEKWLDYTIGQLSELLTRYGPVDVLWFDGAGWMGIKRPEDDLRVRNWIYRLQPQIVINPRWGGKNVNPDYDKQKGHHSLSDISRRVGDFYTYESKWSEIEKRNDGLYADIWFEFCRAWKGHWGYTPADSDQANPKSMQQIVHQLTEIRSFNGNYLLNIGPSEEGEIRPDILAEAQIISRWVKSNGDSILAADGVKAWEKYSTVPLTQNGTSLYAHMTTYSEGGEVITIALPEKPVSVCYLHNGVPARHEYDKGSRSLRILLDKKQKDPLGLSTVVEIKTRTAQQRMSR